MPEFYYLKLSKQEKLLNINIYVIKVSTHNIIHVLNKAGTFADDL